MVVLSVLSDQVIGVIYAVLGTQSLLWLGWGVVVCPFISQEEEFGKVWQILLPASKLKSQPGAGRRLTADHNLP